MSSAAATTSTPRAGALAGARGAERAGWWITPGALIGATMMLAAFAALFFRWFSVQHKHSFGSPDWSHAYIVPLISGYVVYRRRAEIAALRPSVFWPGLLPLALGIVSYYFAIIGVRNHMAQGFAVVMTIAGLALFMLGPTVFRVLAFPIGYLGFGVTIAEMVMLRVTASLQLWSSWGAWVLLNMLSVFFGGGTERAGNVLTMTTGRGQVIPLNVAEACSGMRMVVAFYALGVAVAFLSCRHWWQRVALILLCGPVAILINVFRVAFLGVASIWNPNLAQGEAHMLIGVAWLIPAFALFMSVVWALNRIVAEPAGGAASWRGAA